MCNIFSGLIVTRKGKDWGKVLFLSGVHHEKDREQVKDKYGDNLLAWESNKAYSLTDGFKFTHELNVSRKEQKALMELVEKWAKKQDKEKLLRSMITVNRDNKPIEDYLIIDNMIKLGDNASLVCDFSINIESGENSTQTAGKNSTQKVGKNSTQKAGHNSTQKAGDDSNQTAGYNSTQKAGDDSTQKVGKNSTQTAGDDSTQTAGDDSTQKAGHNSTQKAGWNSTQTAGDDSTQKVGKNSTQTAGHNSTQKAGHNSTQKAGWNSTQTAGHNSTQKAGHNSTQTAGDDSNQTAGYNSTQTAGYNSTQTAGDDSTQTAVYNSTQKAGRNSICIVYGDTSYIVLDGKNVLLTQIYLENGKCNRAILEVNKLFKKYKRGDKIKIVKGKDVSVCAVKEVLE